LSSVFSNQVIPYVLSLENCGAKFPRDIVSMGPFISGTRGYGILIEGRDVSVYPMTPSSKASFKTDVLGIINRKDEILFLMKRNICTRSAAFVFVSEILE